jgi:hypothetical protein
MKKFEYCYLSYESGEITFSNGQLIPIDLNHCGSAFEDLGKNGWEMVGCGNVGSMHVVYFKREMNYCRSGRSEAIKYYLQNNHLRMVDLK